MSDPVPDPADSTPKIAYCVNTPKCYSMKSILSGSNIQYNKLPTGGNDPSISKKMLYSQVVRTSKTKTGFL
jgi:hypothetical protein